MDGLVEKSINAKEIISSSISGVCKCDLSLNRRSGWVRLVVRYGVINFRLCYRFFLLLLFNFLWVLRWVITTLCRIQSNVCTICLDHVLLQVILGNMRWALLARYFRLWLWRQFIHWRLQIGVLTSSIVEIGYGLVIDIGLSNWWSTIDARWRCCIVSSSRWCWYYLRFRIDNYLVWNLFTNFRLVMYRLIGYKLLLSRRVWL
jgi:hypothetical protein